MDFIKIDTQGHDYKVIKGGKESILTFLPYVLFEYDKQEWVKSGAYYADCVGFFKQAGYSLYVLSTGGIMQDIEQEVLDFANVLAVPPLKQS